MTFQIQESRYGDVTVSGNTKTKDYVILREIDIKPGERVNETEIRNNLRRIFNLNYFSEVLPDITLSTSTENTYDLMINVKEKY